MDTIDGSGAVLTYDTAVSLSVLCSHNYGQLGHIAADRLQVCLASRLRAFVFWLLLCGFAVSRSTGGMLARHHELSIRARMQLRVRTLYSRMRPRAQRREEEVSQPLHLLTYPAQSD